MVILTLKPLIGRVYGFHDGRLVVGFQGRKAPVYLAALLALGQEAAEALG